MSTGLRNYVTLTVVFLSITTSAFSQTNFSFKNASGFEIVSVGGSSYNSKWTTDVDIISLSNRSHRAGTPIPRELYDFGGVLSNNTVFIVGGRISSQFWAYDILNDSWNTLDEFPFLIDGNVVVALNDSILTIGGAWESERSIGYMKYTYAYYPAKLAWTRMSGLLPAEPTLLYRACAVVVQRSIYLVDTVGKMYRSSDGALTWTNLTAMSKGRAEASCVAMGNDKILVAGGKSGSSVISTAEVFDIAAGTWSTVAPMRKKRTSAKSVVIPETKNAVVCGGWGYRARRKVVFADCELYDFESNRWSAADFGLNIPRQGFGLFISPKF